MVAEDWSRSHHTMSSLMTQCPPDRGGHDAGPVDGEHRLGVELHRGETGAAQGVHLTGQWVTAHLHRSDAVDVAPVLGTAGGERVVEPHLLPRTEQVDLPLHALVGCVTTYEVQSQPPAEHLVAQADGDEGPA